MNIWEEKDNCKRCKYILMTQCGRMVTEEDCKDCEDRPEDKK